MSIRYDYGSSSKRFGVLDYKNVASAAGRPFDGGMGPSSTPGSYGVPGVASDPMGLVGQSSTQADSANPFSFNAEGGVLDEDTMSTDSVEAGRNAYSAPPEGELQTPGSKTRVYNPPGSAGRTPVTSNPTRPGMGRPDIIVNDKPQAPAPSEQSDSKRGEAKARSQKYIKKSSEAK